MNSYVQSLLRVLRTIEGAPFEQRGEMYEESLVLLKKVQADYRIWRLRLFQEYIAQFSMIQSVELVLDVDEEEGLSEFWGINLHAQEWEAYLPIHWLVDSFADHEKGTYGVARSHFVAGLAKRGIIVDELFWTRVQELSQLVSEDLSFWSGVSSIYVRTAPNG